MLSTYRQVIDILRLTGIVGFYVFGESGMYVNLLSFSPQVIGLISVLARYSVSFLVYVKQVNYGMAASTNRNYELTGT